MEEKMQLSRIRLQDKTEEQVWFGKEISREGSFWFDCNNPGEQKPQESMKWLERCEPPVMSVIGSHSLVCKASSTQGLFEQSI